MNFLNELETLVFVGALLMFPSLLRVSHVVNSQHMLKAGDVQIQRDCVILSVKSSKTNHFGKIELIPIAASNDTSICVVRALYYMFKVRGQTKKWFS